MKSASVLRASTNARWGSPLTLTVIGISATGGLLEGAGHGTGDELGRDRLSVAAAGVDVVGRVELGGRGLADLEQCVPVQARRLGAGEGGLDAGRLDRRAADAEQADTGPG